MLLLLRYWIINFGFMQRFQFMFILFARLHIDSCKTPARAFNFNFSNIQNKRFPTPKKSKQIISIIIYWGARHLWLQHCVYGICQFYFFMRWKINVLSEEENIKTTLNARDNRPFDIFDRENQLRNTTEIVHK